MMEDWRYKFSIVSCFTLMSSAAVYYMNKQRRISVLRKHTCNIPTPPNKLPVLGHLLSLGKIPSKQISQWHKELGPLYQIQMGKQTWIMIADPALAYEIFVKQSSKSSGRGYHTFCVKIYGRDNRGIIFTDYSSKWKCHRKAATAVLSPKSVDRFSEILEFEADSCIERLAAKQGTFMNPYKDLQLSSLNIITTTCLAARFESTDDKTFQKITQFVDGSMMYGGVAGDIGSFIPALSWLDVVMRKEKEMQTFVEEYRDRVYEDLVQKALEGDAECLVKTVYEVKDQLHLDTDDILVFMSDFIGAGADTVAITLYWTFAILSQRQDIQDRLFKELDEWKQKHTDQTPEFSKHRNEFPYMICVQKEVMRFRPTTIFGIPHAASEEIVVKDYVIPKGAILMTSMSDIHRHPNYVDDPETFNPDRFMNNTERMAKSALGKLQERDHFAFGWGRRICPGIHLSEVELFNVYVRLFSKFMIEPERDVSGNPIYVNIQDYHDHGIVAKPLPFKIRLVPRT